MTHPVAPDWDRADRERRREWLEHVERCDDCRQAWLREEPSRLFATLADDPMPRDLLDEVTAGVMQAVAPAMPATRTRWIAAAAWAAALALAAALVPWWGSGPERERIAAALEPAEVQVLEASDSTRVVDVTVGGTQVVMIFDGELEL